MPPTDPKGPAARPDRRPPLCVLCGKPIKGRVYLQAGVTGYPVHRNCRITIRGPRRGE